ncbi:S8 family serine peptidase [Shewanella sp. WXL01]|uniref:S8 family serine peptidase n=1 Tax=Shewanella sp. WXL01 TaxID=2709721 RepID=UPI001438542C|nr:S8 family serine peptidase [Shewanella sp. WXL01]NKF50880.1 S8 family serine peptidase [Shewanella sp. WXL01]
MKFKHCTLAMCVSAALMTTAFSTQVDATVSTDVKPAYGQQQALRTAYTFYLNDVSMLASETQAKASLAQVQKQQQAFFDAVNQIDGNAKLVSSSRLLANIVTIELNPENLPAVQALTDVKYTFKAAETVVLGSSKSTDLMSNQAVLSATQSAQMSEAGDVAKLAPYTGSETAGNGVSVAIISTGIDYTLAEFGGSGEYGDTSDPEVPPAKGTYMDALVNGAIEYDGFPTAVVTGGWDFAGENWGNDANPIDQNYQYESWNGWVFPTGLGTEIASIVHQLAPGAELHAYKVANVSPASWDPDTLEVQVPTMEKIIMALEHALDPNQDGDMSDRLDISLIDAGGAGAFFDIDGNAGPGLMQLMIEKAAGQGMTIVTHAGNGAEYSTFGMAEAKHRSWISYEGSPTSAITVGGVELQDGNTVVPAWAPMGPVRGSQALKPEIVTHTNDVPVVKISNEDPDAPRMSTRSDILSGAAKIAAAAAVIKSHHPSFGPTEIKAMLANTAVNDGILRTDGATTAELLSVGHGVEDVAAAVASPVVMWESSSHQPYIQFGMHEVDEQKVIHKKLTIKNVSDTAQTYAVEFNPFGDKAAQDAITVNLPQSVSIPANATVVVDVTLTIDGTMLPRWPLFMTQDHTDENLTATELNGYLQFTAEGKPPLKLGWMVQARNSTKISKKPMAKEFPEYLGWNSDLGQTEWSHFDWARSLYPDNQYGDPHYQAFAASFTNNSQTETTFQAFPLWIKKDMEPEGKEEVAGHKIRAVGGGIYDDAMCGETGKKLVVAVNFFQPAQMATANYSDKIGPLLFFYDLFYEQLVRDNGWDESFLGAYIYDEAMIVNQPFVALNDSGQPTTFFIDYNKAFDPANRNGRYTESSVPTYFTNNGRNIVSQLCVEDLFHHDLDSVEDFDQNFGFHIETDRDAGIDKGDGLIMVNPLRKGYYTSETQCFTDWFGNEYCEDVVTDKSVNVGFARKSDGDDVSSLTFSHQITVAPGEEVYIASASAPEVWGGPVGEPDKAFMVMSSNDDFFQFGVNGYRDADGNVIAKVVDNQMFMVEENAAAGTVVGELELETSGFFAINGDSTEDFELMIVNSLPGTPFAINQETHELYVVNPDALDYEALQSYDIKLLAKSGNTIGETAVVTVNVGNINDVMPTLNSAVADAISVPALSFNQGESASFSVDIAGLFTDVEGDALSYSVMGDGFKSLSLDGMMVMGEVEASGNYQFTVTASDGEHEVSHSVDVAAEMIATDDDSGSSLGWLSLLIAGFIGLRRRA